MLDGLSKGDCWPDILHTTSDHCTVVSAQQISGKPLENSGASIQTTNIENYCISTILNIYANSITIRNATRATWQRISRD